MLHLGVIDGCGVRPGDSGDPVIKKHAAFGVSSGTGRASGSCVFYYQGAREVEKQMGVDVITAP